MTAAVGLDLRLRHERDADELVLALVSALAGRLGAALLDSLLISTQPVSGTPEGPRVAVAASILPSVASSTALAWGVVLETARDVVGATAQGGPWAVADSDHGAGVPALQPVARQAAADHAARRAGRLVHFPGCALLVGRRCVADVLAGSAIERVAVLAGPDAGPADVIETRDFVRPRWDNGELVLHTQPARGGLLVPFETPNPTPCCADHS